ncbi:MAG: hypothetical protein NTX59_12390 [Elusimicrobia bacterium]|nr:hypothetical protein [Elusimicrobiota bacterium]
MIHALLLRFSNPGLYQAAVALKELRKLVYCLAQKTPDRRRINRAKTRLQDILQKAGNGRSSSNGIRLIRDIEQILSLVEKGFSEIRDYKLAGNPEIVWFFALYLSLLDALGEAFTGHSFGQGEAAARAGKLIAAGRKQLGLFRAGRLSAADDFLGNLKLATLYSDFDKWLYEAEKLSENIISARNKP